MWQESRRRGNFRCFGPKNAVLRARFRWKPYRSGRMNEQQAVWCGKFFWRAQAVVAPGFMPGGRWRHRPGCAGDKPRRYNHHSAVAPGFMPGGRWRRQPGCAGDKPRRYNHHSAVAPGFMPGGRWRHRPGCAGDKPRRYNHHSAVAPVRAAVGGTGQDAPGINPGSCGQAAGNRPPPEIVATAAGRRVLILDHAAGGHYDAPSRRRTQACPP